MSESLGICNESCDCEDVSCVLFSFSFSEGFRDLILKLESAERAVKVFSLLLQELMTISFSIQKDISN